MRAVIVAVALLLAGPAFAIPPVLPPAQARAVADALIRATERNDLAAYASLFAADAKIVTETGATLDRAHWLDAVSADFTPARRTRFLNVFADIGMADGKRVTRVVFVIEQHHCPPFSSECWPRYRTDVATIVGDQVVGLEASGRLGFRRTPEGDWTSFD